MAPLSYVSETVGKHVASSAVSLASETKDKKRDVFDLEPSDVHGLQHGDWFKPAFEKE